MTETLNQNIASNPTEFVKNISEASAELELINKAEDHYEKTQRMVFAINNLLKLTTNTNFLHQESLLPDINQISDNLSDTDPSEIKKSVSAAFKKLIAEEEKEGNKVKLQSMLDNFIKNLDSYLDMIKSNIETVQDFLISNAQVIGEIKSSNDFSAKRKILKEKVPSVCKNHFLAREFMKEFDENTIQDDEALQFFIEVAEFSFDADLLEKIGKTEVGKKGREKNSEAIRNFMLDLKNKPYAGNNVKIVKIKAPSADSFPYGVPSVQFSIGDKSPVYCEDVKLPYPFEPKYNDYYQQAFLNLWKKS